MNRGQQDFQIFRERTAIIDGLRELILSHSTPPATIAKFTQILENEAIKLNRQDVLEDLIFAGLVYG